MPNELNENKRMKNVRRGRKNHQEKTRKEIMRRTKKKKKKYSLEHDPKTISLTHFMDVFLWLKT